MDPLQFSLFFVALLVAYFLVHLRLARFETYMREMAGIKTLNERLQGLVDGMERIRLDRVEEGLQQLHEDLVEVQDALQRVEKAQRSADTGPVVIPGVEPSAADRVRTAVEGRLLTMGYDNLRLLTDLSAANLDEEVEVRVECTKGGMTYKGLVRTRNGNVLGMDMQSVSVAFP